MKKEQYLNLNRQFMPFKDEKDWEIHYTSFGSEGYLGAQTWEQLLTHNRVVVLAEAGAGKTAELRAASERIDAEGSANAFYITLNSVAKRSLYDAFEKREDQKRFKVWESSNSDAWFFVDSLDEARLNGETFQAALSNLEKELSPYLNRAKILISCRVSDWRSLSDAADFEKYLGSDVSSRQVDTRIFTNADDALLSPIFDKINSPESHGDDADTSKQKGGILVVALSPLSHQQANELAAWAGVRKPDAFLQAVHEADATDLANRPQDLLSMAKQWNSDGTIGTKYSALKWSIEQRLRETNLDLAGKDTLTFEQAYGGAKILAAQLTFGKQRLLSWPLEAGVGLTAQDAMDPREALQNFSGNDVTRLLNRAIFDPATFGAVRFHHRSAQELLCAEWLIDQIKNGCPIRRIWQLLTAKKYGKVRFRPSLRPVAAWIAQLEPRILKRVIELEPQLLIEGGDPKLISVEDRKTLLIKFAELHEGRDDAGISIDINQVARLASPELIETIRGLWHRSNKSGELRDLLLRLIWVGKLNDLSDIAVQALKSSKREYERSIAARALVDIASIEQREDIAKYLKKNAKSFPARAIDAAIQIVYPSALDLQGLKQIILKHPIAKRESMHTGLHYGLEQIARNMQPDKLEQFVLFLEKLVKQKPLQDKQIERYSRRHRSLMSPLLLACTRIVTIAGGAAVSKNIVNAIRFSLRETRYGDGYQIGESRKSLAAVIQENRTVNKQLYDLCLEEHDPTDDAAWRFRFGDNFFRESWTTTTGDYDLFVRSLENERDDNRAECLLNTVFGIASISDQKAEFLCKIKSTIKGRTKLEGALNTLVNPPPRKFDDWEKKHNRQMREIKKRNTKKEKQNRQSWIDFRDRLQKKPEELRTNAPFGTLHDIRRWLRFDQNHANRESTSWEGFEQAFGSEVTRAAKDGFIKRWRTCDPGNLYRKGKLTNGGDVGRLGLQIEAAREKNFFTKLTPNDIAVASRLAWTELNDIPNWAVTIWEHRADVAEPIVRQEIRWELSRKTKSQRVEHILYKLERVPEPFKSCLAGWILADIQAKEPTNTSALEKSLGIITGCNSEFTNELSKLSKERFLKLKRRTHRLIWLCVMLSTDAKFGLTCLKQWLKSQKSEKAANQLVVELLATLFPNRGPGYGSLYQDYRKLPYLKELLIIVYRHIRREDDLYHDGVYTPGARDAAQDARSTVLGMLLDIPGEQTTKVLMELARMPEFRASKERFQVLADQRATKDADIEPWSARDIVEFSSRFSPNPKTLPDLHSLVMDRLEDIKDEMESGTFSNKTLLRQDDCKRAEERPVQLAIAQQLALRRNGAYTNVREPEQQDKNEPDILVLNSSIQTVLPIEIKVADSWTYLQLLEAIRGQLVGKYMKERNATHGILLMTYHGKRKKCRHPDTKKFLDFDQLISSLQIDASKIVSKSASLERIDVVGISLLE